MTSHLEESSRVHEDGHRFSSADQALLGQENGASGTEMLKAPSSNEFWNARIGEGEPLSKSPPAEDVLYGFFDPTNSPKAAFLPGIQREEDSAQSHSEEEYEEAIVEPRTLNEITTATDKTSPWSSYVSETEQDPVQMAKDGDRLPKESALRSSSVSDVVQEDPLSVSSVTGSGNGEEDGDNGEEEEGEAGEEEPTAAGRVEAGEIQKVGPGRSTEAQEGGPEEAPSTHNGGGDFVRPWRRVAPEAAEGGENLHRDPQQEEGRNVKGEEGLQLCPPWQDIVRETEACFGEDDEDPPEEFDAPMTTLYPFFPTFVNCAKRPSRL